MAKEKRRWGGAGEPAPQRKETYYWMGIVLVVLLIALVDPAGTTPTEKAMLLPWGAFCGTINATSKTPIMLAPLRALVTVPPPAPLIPTMTVPVATASAPIRSAPGLSTWPVPTLGTVGPSPVT